MKKVRNGLGNVYNRLGQYEQALGVLSERPKHYDKDFRPTCLDVAKCYNVIGNVYSMQGQC
jgi:hypothetical protein